MGRQECKGAKRAISSTSGQVSSPLMTPEELATWLACTRRAVYDRVFRGQIPGSVRVGRRLYFRREDIIVWLGLASQSPPALRSYQPAGARRPPTSNAPEGLP